MKQAMGCLESQRYTDAYTISLVSYAFALYDPTNRTSVEMYRNLLSVAKNGKCEMLSASFMKSHFSAHH